MKSVLMHKNIEVASIECDHSAISSVYEILNSEHMPIGTYKSEMRLDMCNAYLSAWQRMRAIPSDRTNFKLVLQTAKMDIYELCSLSHMMGLTDQYWIKNQNEDVNWEEINFHKNGFKASPLTIFGVGDVSTTPDYETDGSLPKAWFIIDRTPTLLKASPSWLPTASANEVVASQLAEICGVEHATYFPMRLGDKTVCATPCFVNSDKEEYVSLLQYMRTCRIPGIEAGKRLGLNNEFLTNMTAFDLLIGNSDRHEGNFGIIRDPDTTNFLRPAPLFDSGTSLHSRQCGNSFKPFYDSKQAALNSLQGFSFDIPSHETLSNIVQSTYNVFGVQQYAHYAVDELCHNAELLKEQKERARKATLC